jgi:molybdate transport system substrate-binding protein
VILLLLALSCKPEPEACVQPVVLAASDLQYALTELAEQYRQRSGCAPLLAFGSTGTYTSQLEQGARADLFFAANASFIDRLQGQSLLYEDSRTVYGIGRIVLVSSGEPPASLASLTDPAIRYLAIANPEHAPYGLAAQQALQASGLWEAVQPRLVRGENIAQTWQLVQTGNADAGIVALSLVVESTPYTLVDSALHEPLVQVAAVPRSAEHPQAGRDFLAFVLAPEGRAVLQRYGFGP